MNFLRVSKPLNYKMFYSEYTTTVNKQRSLKNLCEQNCAQGVKDLETLSVVHVFPSKVLSRLSTNKNVPNRHLAFTCSKLTIETLEQGVKYVQK